MSERTLGITVLADFILSEGSEAIVENLQRVGATAVACNPTVTAPAPEGTGTFQPPADAGSSPRLFDRKLFGKRALWVQSAPSYVPQAKFYGDAVYGPRKVKDLTHQHGELVGHFVQMALAAGLKVYFQLGACQPSGLRDEDRPCQPDGSIAAERMADTGCLASAAVRGYNSAYVNDLLAAYPAIHGFRIDWPEYPCYTMGEVFHDFSPHVLSWAEAHGLDFASIQDGVRKLYDHLHGRLTNDQLSATGEFGFADGLANLTGVENPAVRHWLELKARLSIELVADWHRTLQQTGRPDLELTAHGFMPPYSTLTGLDFSNVAAHCHSISPKFYTMHWPLMVKFWSDWLIERNPSLERANVVRTVAGWMELGSARQIEDRLERYRYPQPDEEHPVPISVQRRKLQEVRDQIPEKTAAFVPLVHGYGPPHDFENRFRVVAEADVDGVWINRYGYLGDEKLSAVAEVWKECQQK